MKMRIKSERALCHTAYLFCRKKTPAIIEGGDYMFKFLDALNLTVFDNGVLAYGKIVMSYMINFLKAYYGG